MCEDHYIDIPEDKVDIVGELTGKVGELEESLNEQINRGIEPYAEKAEKMNGRWAMVGIVAGAISYALTGNLFFGIF